MSEVFSGSDLIQINSRILADLADGDVAVLDFPNNIVETKVGKNGNSLYAYNEMGQSCSLTLRVTRGSEDDKYINSLLSLYRRNRAGFTTIRVELVKKPLGNASDIYILEGGMIKKYPNTKISTEGDTDALVSEWVIDFTKSQRSIT